VNNTNVIKLCVAVVVQVAALGQGTVTSITGPGTKSIGYPPDENAKDWVAMVRRAQ
jgi:hypothetical protein